VSLSCVEFVCLQPVALAASNGSFYISPETTAEFSEPRNFETPEQVADQDSGLD
jgi:hypothetical protein